MGQNRCVTRSDDKSVAISNEMYRRKELEETIDSLRKTVLIAIPVLTGLSLFYVGLGGGGAALDLAWGSNACVIVSLSLAGTFGPFVFLTVLFGSLEVIHRFKLRRECQEELAHLQQSLDRLATCPIAVPKQKEKRSARPNRLLEGSIEQLQKTRAETLKLCEQYPDLKAGLEGKLQELNQRINALEKQKVAIAA